MPITDVPIFAMLKSRMHWHQERQRVLAENVANADTPGFRPHDLAPPQLARQASAGTAGQVALARTDAAHLQLSAAASGQFQPERRTPYEVRPAGNAVNLEDEMLKVSGNQMEFQAATALYGRSLGLLKTALGRK